MNKTVCLNAPKYMQRDDKSLFLFWCKDSRDSSDDGEEESEGGEEGGEEGEESVKEKEEEEGKPGPLDAEGEAMEVETKTSEKASDKQQGVSLGKVELSDCVQDVM